MPKKKVARKKAAKKVLLGRPKGTGKYGCPTKLIRIPEHMEKEINNLIKHKLKLS